MRARHFLLRTRSFFRASRFNGKLEQGWAVIAPEGGSNIWAAVAGRERLGEETPDKQTQKLALFHMPTCVMHKDTLGWAFTATNVKYADTGIQNPQTHRSVLTPRRSSASCGKASVQAGSSRASVSFWSCLSVRPCGNQQGVNQKETYHQTARTFETYCCIRWLSINWSMKTHFFLLGPSCLLIKPCGNNAP